MEDCEGKERTDLISSCRCPSITKPEGAIVNMEASSLQMQYDKESYSPTQNKMQFTLQFSFHLTGRSWAGLVPGRGMRGKKKNKRRSERSRVAVGEGVGRRISSYCTEKKKAPGWAGGQPSWHTLK